MLHRGFQRRFQRAQAPLLPGGDPQNRHPQPPGQEPQVQRKAFASGLVHEVDADHHPACDLQNLQHQHQIPLQGCGIADHNHPLRLCGAQKIPGNLLLRRVGQQRIGARQIHNFPAAPAAPGKGNGFARPVARMLVHPRKGIEQGAFAHIGVPGQGDAALFHHR